MLFCFEFAEWIIVTFVLRGVSTTRRHCERKKSKIKFEMSIKMFVCEVNKYDKFHLKIPFHNTEKQNIMHFLKTKCLENVEMRK